jgi:SAM-dependent methyltransferase
MKIELGGGLKPVDGYVNLDPVHGNGPWCRQAQDVPWPARDESCEAIHASHVMEHIPAGAPRIAVMNEAWRVLRTGGTFRIIVPHFGTWQAHADPTHVSFWVPESFSYFDGSWTADADYGLAPWQTLSLAIHDGWQICWTGVKLP